MTLRQQARGHASPVAGGDAEEDPITWEARTQHTPFSPSFPLGAGLTLRAEARGKTRIDREHHAPCKPAANEAAAHIGFADVAVPLLRSVLPHRPPKPQSVGQHGGVRMLEPSFSRTRTRSRSPNQCRVLLQLVRPGLTLQNRSPRSRIHTVAGPTVRFRHAPRCRGGRIL